MIDKSYRPEIDGLRSIAVSVVILYHAGLASFSGGYVGVDVFFVISGYLITSILVSDLERGRFSVRTFYERRARRIFPALFFVMLCCLPFGWLWLTPGQFKDFFQSLVSVTLFVSNFFFWLKSGYFGQAAETIPLIHTWSLSVEEQFYLVHPLALLLLWRYARSRLSLVLVLLAGLSLASCLWLEHRNPGLNFFFSPSRAWELLAGAFVALHGRAWLAGRLGGHAGRELLSTLGLLLVLVPVFLYDRHTVFPGHLAIPPVLGSALILCFCTADTRLGRLLASRPMVAVGLASYSAYLWHQPVFAFARVLSADHPGAATLVALLPLVALLSYLSWRYVEAPFRRPAQVTGRSIFRLSLACSLAFGALGVGGHLLKGLPQRFDADRSALAATSRPSPQRDKCHTDGLRYLPPGKACRYLAEPASWAVFGDSHGVEVAYALAERLLPQRQGVLHLTFSGCPPALNFDAAAPGCSAWVAESLAYLEGHADIQHVLLAFRHSMHLYGDQLRGFPQAPADAPRFLPQLSPDAARLAYWSSLQDIVTRLARAGKTVYLLDPVPELGASIDRNIFKRGLWLNQGIDPAGAPLAYHALRNGPILERLSLPPFSTLAKRVRSADAVCNSSSCWSIVDGQALYFDDNHLSLAGARRVIDLMARDPQAALAQTPAAAAAAAQNLAPDTESKR